MPGDYSEEDVRLGARAFRAVDSATEIIPYETFARALLDDLASRARLVPEGSQVREEWRLRFDYADGSDGRLTTASEDEARRWVRAHSGCKHDTELVGRRVISTLWTPTEPEVKP